MEVMGSPENRPTFPRPQPSNLGVALSIVLYEAFRQEPGPQGRGAVCSAPQGLKLTANSYKTGRNFWISYGVTWMR